MSTRKASGPNHELTFGIAPLTEGYVERLFSVCGLLSSGRRNRMTRSLTESVCRSAWAFCVHLGFL